MSYFVVKNRHAVPSFLVYLVGSWAISNLVFTGVAIAIWLAGPKLGSGVRPMPWPILLVLAVGGAYVAIGSLCLYLTMWVYWFAVDRSPWILRAIWFLLLLFGLHYGATLYALVVWKRDLKKIEGFQPLRNRAPVISGASSDC